MTGQLTNWEGEFAQFVTHVEEWTMGRDLFGRSMPPLKSIRFQFPNGWGASVIQGLAFENSRLFEIGVLWKDKVWMREDPFGSEGECYSGVISGLEPHEVTDWLRRIMRLDPIQEGDHHNSLI